MPVKLVALDGDDLAVISAHVQDAVVRAADIVWQPGDKRLVIGMSRPDWEQALGGAASPRRLISVLRFDRVLACRSRRIERDGPRARLNIVGVAFHPATPPGGHVVLMFGDGAALRLDVECLECELVDIGRDGSGEAVSGDASLSSPARP